MMESKTIIIIAALMISIPLRKLSGMNEFDYNFLKVLLTITIIIDIFDYFKNDRKIK